MFQNSVELRGKSKCDNKFKMTQNLWNYQAMRKEAGSMCISEQKRSAWQETGSLVPDLGLDVLVTLICLAT